MDVTLRGARRARPRDDDAGRHGDERRGRPAEQDRAADSDVAAHMRAAVVVALAVSVALRLWTRSHLWLDEALAVNIARLPLDRLPDALRHDGAPPLYYVLLHGWMRVWGTGDVAVRLLSGTIAVATLPLAWAAGRRLGGRRVGWAAVLLLASSPFAVHYATETRMYSLVIALVMAGYLSVAAALARPTRGPLALVALVTGLLLLTHYWSLYLLSVVVVALGVRAARGPGRVAARRTLAAVAAGSLLFLPWAPVFVHQLLNTGTPWGGPPGLRSLFNAVTDFTGHGEAGVPLGLLYWALIALAVLGRPLDDRRVELDLRTRPSPARQLALVSFATLAAAIVVGGATGGAYSVRYAAVAFPLLLLAVACGTAVLAGERTRRRVLVTATVLGLVSAAPNAWTERTSAPRVARALAADGRPGDVVAYCPDQLGPSVSRLLADHFVQLTFPDARPPDRVDWVDYEERNRAARTAPFARMLLDRAGADHDVWLVWSPGYRTFGTKCQALISRLTEARPRTTRVVKVAPRYLEHPGLVRFRPG